NRYELHGTYEKMPIMQFILIERYDGIQKKATALSMLRNAGIPDEIALEIAGFDKNIQLKELQQEQQQQQEEDETNMAPHMNPKTPPGVSKRPIPLGLKVGKESQTFKNCFSIKFAYPNARPKFFQAKKNRKFLRFFSLKKLRVGVHLGGQI
ncbi:MAG: hypothetical protein GY931_13320, partial [Maribacter sp.]|nr:hypothetical protein [Maribacter sp.]